jgi:hypothetical protein
MARDVRQFGDPQIDYWLSQPGISPELKAELLAEKARRAAPNVQSNLDAAATPITPEPVAGPAKPVDPDVRTLASMTDEEMLAPVTADSLRPTKAGLPAYGDRYREAVANTIDAGVARRQAARSEGYEDPEQLAYNAAAGVLPEDYVAAGRPMPTALRPQAPEAAMPVSEDDPDYWESRYQQEVVGPPRAEPSDSVGRVNAYFADKAKRSESGHLLPQYQKPTFDEWMAVQAGQMARENARKNMETYGVGPNITPAQQTARDERTKSENKMRGTRIDGIINRLASQTGTPRSEIRARLAGLQEPDFEGNKAIDLDDGLSPQEVAMLGQPFTDDARDRKDMEVAADRAFNKRRGRMAGSNLRANAANNWNDMPADWQNFVRAGGRGATPLDVEGRQLEQAARWAGQAVTGAIAGGAGSGQALQLRQEQRMQELRSIAGKAKHESWGPTYARTDVEETLDKAGASPEEKQMILGELFGSTPTPASAPLPLPEGHGNPGRMPDGVYPMM